MSKHESTEIDYNKLVVFVVGHELRVKILKYLYGKKNVTTIDLAEALDEDRSKISFHLSQLEGKDLVTTFVELHKKMANITDLGKNILKEIGKKE